MATILIVEDESSIRKLAAVNLRARGYRVVEAGSAEQGLIELSRNAVGLILLDIKLPGMTGWQLLEAEGVSTIPVIVMTASAGDVQINARKYGNIIQVFIKPFDTPALIQVVQRTLS